MADFSAIEGNYLLLLPVFLLPLLYIIFKQFKPSVVPPFPPGPTPWPIFGNIFQMGGETLPQVTLRNFAQTYGPLMLLKLGSQYMVVGSSIEAAVEILKTHDRILSARNIPKVLSFKQDELNYSSITWSQECHEGWRRLRTLCRSELFSAKSLDAQSSLREKKVMQMVEHLREREGEVVDVGELVFATAFNMLSNAILSRDLIKLDAENADGGMKGVIRTMIELGSTPNVSDFFPILTKLDLQGLDKKAKKLLTRFRAIWEPIIEEKRETGPSLSQQDFLDVLLQNNFTNDQIHELLTDLFGAGADTCSSTIEWAMAELVKNPETMRKVREEFEREISTQDFLNESHLMQLPYLQACVKETFRLHPPGPLLLPHRASETCQVMGYTIPENAQIVVNIWAIARDPSIWDEPLKFRPERFLNCTMDFKGHDFELIPFSAGRRLCPGLPMATRQLPLVLASLIYFLDWSLPNGLDHHQLDMNEKFRISLQKRKAIPPHPQSNQMITIERL